VFRAVRGGVKHETRGKQGGNLRRAGGIDGINTAGLRFFLAPFCLSVNIP